jgi:hypothetical protein
MYFYFQGPFGHQTNPIFMPRDNPQVQGIYVTPISVEVLGIELQEQEGKEINSLKLECHNSSYLCTTQNKETGEIDLVIARNKVTKKGK